MGHQPKPKPAGCRSAPTEAQLRKALRKSALKMTSSTDSSRSIIGDVEAVDGGGCVVLSAELAADAVVLATAGSPPINWAVNVDVARIVSLPAVAEDCRIAMK